MSMGHNLNKETRYYNIFDWLGYNVGNCKIWTDIEQSKQNCKHLHDNTKRQNGFQMSQKVIWEKLKE